MFGFGFFVAALVVVMILAVAYLVPKSVRSIARHRQADAARDRSVDAFLRDQGYVDGVLVSPEVPKPNERR